MNEAVRLRLMKLLVDDSFTDESSVREAIFRVANGSNRFEDYLLAAEFCEMYDFSQEEKEIWRLAEEMGFPEKDIINYRLGFIETNEANYRAAIKHLEKVTGLKPIGVVMYLKALCGDRQYSKAKTVVVRCLKNPEYRNELYEHKEHLPAILRTYLK